MTTQQLHRDCESQALAALAHVKAGHNVLIFADSVPWMQAALDQTLLILHRSRPRTPFRQLRAWALEFPFSTGPRQVHFTTRLNFRAKFHGHTGKTLFVGYAPGEEETQLAALRDRHP